MRNERRETSDLEGGATRGTRSFHIDLLDG